MNEKADVSILGCGWLGLPLAEKLVHSGYRVKGSTTSPARLELLQQKQIEPYLVNLQPEETDPESLTSFLNTKTLVLNIPPRLRAGEGEQYLYRLHVLLKSLLTSPISRILFVSSTAIYPDLNREVTEDDISYTAPDNVLLQAEKLFQDREEWLTTIVRFGGLIGGNRHPGRFMAGKENLPNGNAPVNLIHLDDCVTILSRIIEQEMWGRVYNACADEHPTRKHFYTQAALSIGALPPTFAETTAAESFKRISSQKLKEELSYHFLHPNPLEV
ncbi:SDR family oxidoreductase [Botryobacter ruber]|uniref:SDR family oxidoreductase n=1 Tax=Botryobacter ruber TaxID=2171629 RepID=UPI000E0A8EDD|nr:SDR family oxidoreductase [Botryobacter ruber]